MKRILLLSAMIVLTLSLFADIPTGYYDSATGSGYTLKTQLFSIIKNNHLTLDYGDLYGYYETTDNININGTDYVYDMYSIRADESADYYFQHVSGDQCGTYSGESDCYNREHSLPQSWFNENSPMKADLFHVYPTDGYVNNRRSSYPFGEVGTASWTSSNGSKVGSCNYPGYSGTVFEPIDEFKGDFARTYFYMATRYQDIIDTWSSNSSTADDVLNETEDQVFEDWFLNMLIEWHTNDPVSQRELDRNDAVYAVQKNRNPFIDHPEYVAKIWGGAGVFISNVVQNPTAPKSTDLVNVTADITSADATITTANLKWGTTAGVYGNTIVMSNSGDSYSASIPAQNDGTAVYYIIEAEDDNAEIASTQEYSFIVEDNPTMTIYEEDFSACPATGWIIYSSASNMDWTCGSGYQSINAYGGDEASDDWLISPAQNLDSYFNEKLSFSSWTRFTDISYPPIELLYSLDYLGTGDPSLATWVPLMATWSAQDSQSWTESGDIDISGIDGSEVYFAFHYISSGTGAGSSALWETDNFLITGKENQNPVVTNVSNTPDIPLQNEDVTISAIITDDGTITVSKIKWGISSGTYNNTDTLTYSGSNDIFSGVIAAQAAETTVYYLIEAKDDFGGSFRSNEYSYTVAANQTPVITEVDKSPELPTDADDISITATITDSDGTISTATIKWGTSEGGPYSNTISMGNVGDAYSGIISAQIGGTNIHYVIEAIDNNGGSTRSEEESFTVNTTGNNPPVISNLLFNPTDPESSEMVIVTATITDPDDLISLAKIKWGTEPDSYDNEVLMTNIDDVYSGSIPAQADDTHVYFIVEARDGSGGLTKTAEQDYVVFDPNILPVIADVNFDPSDPESDEDVRVSATITDSDGTISVAQLKWGTNSGVYTNTVTMSGTNDDYLGTIPMQADGTHVYFIIYAEDNESAADQSDEFDYIVDDLILPEISGTAIDPSNPTENDAVSITATISDSDGTIENAELHWGISSGSLTNTISMSVSSGETYITSSNIPAQTVGTIVYYEIEVTDNDDLVVKQTGNYTVSSSDGINTLTDLQLRIYPNPTSDKLYIKVEKEDQLKSVIVYNLIGEKIIEMNDLNSTNCSINFNDYPKGVYIVQIQGENNLNVKKIMYK